MLILRIQILVGAIVFVFVGCSDSGDSTPQVMSADMFTKEFLAANEASERIYDDKLVLISGVASFAGADDEGFVEVILEGASSNNGSDQISIVCNFPIRMKDAVSRINRGDTVTVRGICSGGLLDNQLELVLCEFVE